MVRSCYSKILATCTIMTFYSFISMAAQQGQQHSAQHSTLVSQAVPALLALSQGLEELGKSATSSGKTKDLLSIKLQPDF